MTFGLRLPVPVPLKLGQWIDRHFPRDIGASGGQYGFQYDWCHPTVDVAISSGGCSPTAPRIGVWDDTVGSIDSSYPSTAL